MRHDNQLLKTALHEIRSIDRRHAWRTRYAATFGIQPEHDPRLQRARGKWHIYVIKRLMKDACKMAGAQTNTNVVKFPRRHGQYGHGVTPGTAA